MKSSVGGSDLKEGVRDERERRESWRCGEGVLE